MAHQLRRFVMSLILILIALVWGRAYAQEIPYSIPRIVGGEKSTIGRAQGISGVDCETTKAEMDFAMIAAGVPPASDESIIVISRLGGGEVSRKLSRVRLDALVNYMTEVRGFSKEQVVTGEGERVRGLGRVEVYVKGKLHTVFNLRRNKDFGTGCVPHG